MLIITQMWPWAPSMTLWFYSGEKSFTFYRCKIQHIFLLTMASFSSALFVNLQVASCYPRDQRNIHRSSAHRSGAAQLQGQDGSLVRSEPTLTSATASES